MAVDPMNPEVLVSVPDEMEAAEIVSILADNGIHARAVGGYTSGFRAEAPGEVSVVVGHADLSRAEDALSEFQKERPEIDWSKIDFSDGESPSDNDDCPTSADFNTVSGCAPAASHEKHGRFQFSIATLLVLQIVVSIAMAAWKGCYAGLLIALVLIGATFALIITGTVVIASDLDRTRQAWTYVGRALIVALAVVGLFLLIRAVLETPGFVL